MREASFLQRERQPALPGLAPPPKLTDREQLALTIIQERPRITARELGEAVRLARGTRGADYDSSNGLKLGRKLKALGLVREVKGQRFVDGTPKPVEPEPECCDQFPFCECTTEGAPA